MEKKNTEYIKSETIAIPDPSPQKSTSPSRPPPGFGGNSSAPGNVNSRNNNIDPQAIETRTYTIDQILSLRDDPMLQDWHQKLPEEINGKLLTGAARKRRYPFVNERHRKNQDGPRWKDKKWSGKKEAESLDDIVEVEEHDEHRNDTEPDPDWAEADEEQIKQGGKFFQFQALDRTEEREVFAKTGKVPAKPVLAKPDPPEKTDPEPNNQLESLFRNATLRSFPSMPDSAVDAKTLEQSSSLFSDKGLGAVFGGTFDGFQNRRERDIGGMNPLDRDLSASGGRSPPRNQFGSRDLGGRELSGNELERRRHDIVSRSPNPPTRREEATSPRIAEFDLTIATRLNENNPDISQATKDPQSLSHSPNREVGSQPPHTGETDGMDERKNRSSKPSILDPTQRMDNILYEITNPVRPCVGGQFFAAARPLTNKELYDYSPKFKEIQDTRHKELHRSFQKSNHGAHRPARHGSEQMVRRSLQKQRHQLMMEKYAVAKKMYDAPQRSDGYPPSGMMSRYQGGERSAERYDSMHGQHGPPKDPRARMDYPPQRHRSGERSMGRGQGRQHYNAPPRGLADYGGYEPGF